MPQEETSPSPPVEELSLRQRTTRGVMWVAAQAMVTRVVTLVQQLALAWLISKSDFGLIGLALTVTSLVTLMANPGIDAVLVQRLRRYHYWATPAFWLGLTMGLVGFIVLLVLAPVAAWLYDQPKLVGLIAVVATSLPIQSLQIVSKAQLQLQMRFKTIVLLALLGSVLTAILTIAAAYIGLGAYSFVLPIPLSAMVTAAVTWRLANPPVRWHLEFSRWKYLLGKSTTVGATHLLSVLINQADYIALGLAGISEASIGAYVLAFNIAVQPLRLFSSNVPVVLFPGLSQLSLEPEKQVRATLRAMRLLTLVTVPVCLLQIVLSTPIFRLVFPPIWMEAVPPCQILTFGLMMNAACWPAISLMLAQGRFREQLRTMVIGTVVFVAVLGGVTWILPSIVSVAAVVALWHSFFSPFYHWVATRRFASRFSFLLETGPSLLAGLLAAVPCIILQQKLPPTIVGDLIAIIAGGVVFAVIYLLMVYLLVPASLYDLRQQIAPLWARWSGTQAPVPDAASGDGVAM
jgi:O-antigen/teichoic acid export membrane protein